MLKQTYAYDDVTLIPQYSELKSRSQANPQMKEYQLPIIASCMDTLGKETMKVIIKNNIPFIANRAFKTPKEQFFYFFEDYMKDAKSISFNVDKKQMLKNVWFAVGSLQKYKDWIDCLFYLGVRRFCVDMAHGDSKACIDTIKYIKSLNSNVGEYTIYGHNDVLSIPHVIAGNVATAEGFRRLEKAGADGIRIGVASGSICSTALNTGFGVPILTNIIDCYNARKNRNTWIIADGGVKYTGDIAKAVYFGADFCMMGKMLASTDTALGNCYNKDGQLISSSNIKFSDEEPNFNRPIYPEEFNEIYKLAQKFDWEKQDAKSTRKNLVKNNLVAYKEYHGMASRDARKNLLSYASVEGRSGIIEYTKTTQLFIYDTYLNLQASLSYGGSLNWNEFRRKVEACFRSNAGIIAAQTHLDKTFDK